MRIGLRCLGYPVVTEIIFLCGGIAVPGLEHADQILGFVLPPVGTHGIVALGSIVLNIRLKIHILVCLGYAEISGKNMPENAMVR